jgi:molybdopterin-guanine dinucleotide biosynthesis protein A
MTGLVLAGGESRRMGTNKAFLQINGLPMVEHVIRTLRNVCGHVVVVTNSPDLYARYDVEIAGDAFNSRGALVGIYSGLLRSRSERSLVVACDMPFLNAGLLSYMTGMAGDYDVVLPRVGDLIEPLHAVYSRELLPVIEDHLRRDQRRIRDILAGIRVQYVREEEIDMFDPARRSFLNLNTRKEYEEVTCSDLECRN